MGSLERTCIAQAKSGLTMRDFLLTILSSLTRLDIGIVCEWKQRLATPGEVEQAKNPFS
jgi:hypothetical protein